MRSEAPPLGRLASLQAIFAAAFSVLAGSATAVQLAFGLSKLGGLEYANRVLVLSSVRVMGPSISISAALVALLVWTQPLAADAVRPSLLRAAPFTLLLAFVSVVVTTALTVLSGLCVVYWGHDVSWAPIATSRSVLTLDDIPGAFRSFVRSAAFAGTFCWFALPAMRRRAWPLSRALGALFWTVVLLRVAFELAHMLSAPASPLLGE
jgi:hypothetical protein